MYFLAFVLCDFMLCENTSCAFREHLQVHMMHPLGYTDTFNNNKHNVRVMYGYLMVRKHDICTLMLSESTMISVSMVWHTSLTIN